MVITIFKPISSEPRVSNICPSLWTDSSSTVMSSSPSPFALSSYQQASSQHMNGLAPCAASSSHTSMLLYRDCKRLITRWNSGTYNVCIKKIHFMMNVFFFFQFTLGELGYMYLSKFHIQGAAGDAEIHCGGLCCIQSLLSYSRCCWNDLLSHKRSFTPIPSLFSEHLVFFFFQVIKSILWLDEVGRRDRWSHNHYLVQSEHTLYSVKKSCLLNGGDEWAAPCV